MVGPVGRHVRRHRWSYPLAFRVRLAPALPDAVIGRREKVVVEELRPARCIAQHRLHPVLELWIDIDQFGRQLIVQVNPPDAIAGRFEEEFRVGIADQGIAAFGLCRRPPATPNAVAPTLSLMSHVSSSLLAIGIPSPVSVHQAYMKT